MTPKKTKIILTFGCLSGLLSVAMMFGTLPFVDAIGFDKGAIVGYTSIVISFLFVFFGVRAYRQSLDGAPLTFANAFGVGILISMSLFGVAFARVMSIAVAVRLGQAAAVVMAVASIGLGVFWIAQA